MSIELTNTLPTILLGLMIALTLVLLPRLNDDAPRRPDDPPPQEATPPQQDHTP